MNKIIIAFFVVLIVVLATLGFIIFKRETAITLHCKSDIDIYMANDEYIKGIISFDLLNNNTGVAHIIGKLYVDNTPHKINGESGFQYRLIDIKRGLFEIDKTYSKLILQDAEADEIKNSLLIKKMFEGSHYLIIKKVNSNTYFISYTGYPIMLCVNENNKVK